MSIQYAPSRAVTSFTSTTTTNFISGVVSALTSTGWTTTSTTTGTVMSSTTTPQGLSCKVRVYDNGGTIQITWLTDDELIESAPMYMDHVGTYTVLVNPYQFFLFTSGSGTKQYVAGGTPWVPAFLVEANAGVYQAIWAQNNGGASSGDTITTQTFRTSLTTGKPGAMGKTFQLVNKVYWNGNANSHLSNLHFPGWQSLMIPGVPNTTLQVSPSADAGALWADGCYFLSEAVIGWGLRNHGEPIKWVGQIWDAAVVRRNFEKDAVQTLFSFDWHNITDNNTGFSDAYGTYASGSLIIRIS